MERGLGIGGGHSGGGRQGGHSISNMMIIKLGPTIAAYEACITLFLIFSSGVGGISRSQARMKPDRSSLLFSGFESFSMRLLRELDLRYLRNELMLSFGSSGAGALCARWH